MLKKAIIASLLVVALVTTFVITQLTTFADDLLGNNTFDGGVGLPWHTCETSPAKSEFSIKDGKYYVKVTNVGTNRWDAQFRHRAIVLQSGHTYNVKFTVKADANAEIYAKVGDQKDPYTEDWNIGMVGGKNDWQPKQLTANTAFTVNETFTAKRDAKVCEFAFHIGGPKVPANTTFTFDDIYLSDAQYTKPPVTASPKPRMIRANQLGYYPNLAKIATYTTSSTSAQTWKLVDSSGSTLTTGTTKTFGADKDSGDSVQIIDFSSYKTSGKSLKLVVGSDESQPFDIGTDMYSKLVYDSLKYFYHCRSGVPIEMPYCNESQYARPAGHNPDIVPTEQGVKQADSWAYSHNHSLDITGGWYDAGDHGKYVVNGGITVWTMQNQYERTLHINGANSKPYADGTMNIPESKNNIPDILDESRIQMEVMLKMQVPAGMPLAGMVHHKGHDEVWTGLAVRPDQDKLKRILKPPTTAASLNLAANAAQASRLWKQYDATFASKCITAAEIAWKAALANPTIYAPLDEANGGGPYGDNYVLDDFYWAACELFITTGSSEYYDYMKNSDWFLKCPSKLDKGEEIDTPGSFNWGNTHSMGTISLAYVPNKLSSTELQTAKNNIAKAADDFIAMENSQGYGIPLKQCTGLAGVSSGYPWGSNSFVMNNGIVMAAAYDMTKDVKYLNGVAGAMDYLFGRNPLEFSYVTGYGENAAQWPHHRFFSYQVDPTFPKAPAGIAVGGPNSGLQDPWVKGSGWLPGVRAPQKCYMDHIESWSTNECTINWNAPMAWLAGFMNENGGANPGPVTTPPTTSPITTPPTGDVLLGDVDGNGRINSTDSALVVRYVLGMIDLTGNKFLAADVTKDGRITTTDAAKIDKYINGAINSF